MKKQKVFIAKVMEGVSLFNVLICSTAVNILFFGGGIPLVVYLFLFFGALAASLQLWIASEIIQYLAIIASNTSASKPSEPLPTKPTPQATARDKRIEAILLEIAGKELSESDRPTPVGRPKHDRDPPPP